MVEKALESAGTNGGAAEIASSIRRAMKNYLFKKTKQSPMIIPLIQEL
ncbi:MAG: hypothetical protein ACI4ST_07385 [Candidatus Gallimonas sp.]